MAYWLTFAALAGSLLLTALALLYSRQRGLLDLPGARRSHQVPTPRGGGIGIVLVLVASVIGLVIKESLDPAWSLFFLVALILVAVVGWIDDHRPLGIATRLAAHAIGGVLVVVATLPLDSWQPLNLLIAVLAWLAVVGAINASNFMDGINGIASSQAGLLAVVLAPLFQSAGQSNEALLCLAFAAACFGFLPFNLPQARIFLGDVGSGALGLTVAALLLLAWQRDVAPLAALLLLPSAFAIDAGLTLLSRVVRGRVWYRPHREHLYQWWVRSGHSHAFVTAAYAIWTAFMACLLWLSPHVGDNGGIVMTLTVYLAGAGGWCFERRRLLRVARHGGRRS